MLIGAIIKYEDNIAKVHCVVIAMVLELVLSCAASLSLPSPYLLGGRYHFELIPFSDALKQRLLHLVTLVCTSTHAAFDAGIAIVVSSLYAYYQHATPSLKKKSLSDKSGEEDMCVDVDAENSLPTAARASGRRLRLESAPDDEDPNPQPM
jgi:hypothetical protein